MSKTNFSIKPWEGEPGYLCLPMVKNVPEGHPGWEKIMCPEGCGKECWMPEEAKKLIESGAVKGACTECSLRAGLNQRK